MTAGEQTQLADKPRYGGYGIKTRRRKRYDMAIEALIQIGNNTSLDKQKNDAMYKDQDIVEARFDSDPRMWSPGEARRLVKIPDIEVNKLCVTYGCTEDELPKKLTEPELEEISINGEQIFMTRQRRKIRCGVVPSKDVVLEVLDTDIVLKPSNIIG